MASKQATRKVWPVLDGYQSATLQRAPWDGSTAVTSTLPTFVDAPTPGSQAFQMPVDPWLERLLPPEELYWLISAPLGVESR